MLPPSSPVPRVIVEYDDDPAGAADALLAVLRQPRASVEPRNEDEKATAEDSVAA